MYLKQISREVLEDLYHNQKLSIRNIAKETGMTRGQIENLMESYDIPRRTYTEAKKNLDCKIASVKADESIIMAKEHAARDVVCKTKFIPTKRKNMMVPMLLDNKIKEATVTLVMSDLHLGDGDHLPLSYWSTVENVKSIIADIKTKYNVKEFNLVLNGDIVTGRDVYKGQFLRNIVQRGHWQVFLAEIILKDTIEKLGEKVNFTYMSKGTHDGYDFNETLIMKKILPFETFGKTMYLSNGGIVNIAGNLGVYNVLFTHGYGFNAANPVPTKLLTDVTNAVNNYKTRGIQVDRACSGHTHWLSSGLIIDELYWDTCGGFQKWEQSLSQRPCGMIIYIYNNGESISIPVRPNKEVEIAEKNEPGLEYKNMNYYSNYLIKHLETIEGVC